MSTNLLSLPMPGVIIFSLTSSTFEVPSFKLLLLASTLFKVCSAFSASSVYLIPLNPIFLIKAGIAAPMLSAVAPVAKPLNISLAKSSLGSKVWAAPAAAPSPIPAPKDLYNRPKAGLKAALAAKRCLLSLLLQHLLVFLKLTF